MKGEFLEAYEDLFNDAYQRLFRALKIKLAAMKHCQKVLDQEVNNKFKKMLAMLMKKDCLFHGTTVLLLFQV